MSNMPHQYTDLSSENDEIPVAYDSDLKGLFLKCEAHHSTYFYRFHDRYGQDHCLTIGDADLISVDDARRLARHYGRQILMADLMADEGASRGNAPSRPSPSTALKPLVDAVNKANHKKQSALTLADFVSQRYAPHAKATKRGFITEESILGNHILPALGHRPLCEINKNEITALIHSKLTTLKSGTINRIINCLKVIFSRAVEWEIDGITDNPLKGIKQFPNSSRYERYLSQDEADKLLRAVLLSNNRLLAPIISSLLLTGCRKREILDARWDCVDLERGILTVPISKSGKPRQVVLSDTVKTIFMDTKIFLRTEMGCEAADQCPWVFPNPLTGKPFQGIFKSWDAARISVGLKDLRVHDLRHSFASALVNKGNSLYDVQKLLGHSSSRMTERYAHLTAERLTSVASEVSKHYQIPARGDGKACRD